MVQGIGNVQKYELIPSLYRRKDISDIDEFIKIDMGITEDLELKGVAYNSEISTNTYFHNLFILQHYGCPTRLLDWTENPFVALFFTLESALRYNVAPKENACVWVLDPINWNNMVHSGYSTNPPNKILSHKDDQVKAYDINELRKSDRKYPIAISGTHNSRRIVAQKGTFVIFGKNTKSMDKVLLDFPHANTSILRKLVLPKKLLSEIFRDLQRYGITDSVLFPELDGLCKELSRKYGYRS